MITIVTVCYNAEKIINETLEAVYNQTYNNIEYLIIDGASKDNTLETIKAYEKKFQEKGIIYKWVSEPDKGIYDAMNKGANMATGDWIYYLNCGDLFYNNNVLSEIFENENNYKSNKIIYGDVVKVFKNKQEYFKQDKVSRKYLLLSMICHQSLFMRKDSFIQFGNFDLNYNIVADYKKILEIYFENNNNLKYLNKTIAFYDMNGFSENNYKKMNEQRLEIIKPIFNKTEYIYANFIYFLRNMKRSILINYTKERE